MTFARAFTSSSPRTMLERLESPIKIAERSAVEKTFLSILYSGIISKPPPTPEIERMGTPAILITVYIYTLDTLADWEPGYAIAELNSKRFFKKDAPNISVKTVGISKEPVRTMGGFTIIPDCSISDIAVNEKSVLLLPGANTWNDSKHGVIIEKAGELLLAGATVCAICGATVALASAGLLDHRPHTSNGMGYLEMCCPHYKGQHFYVDTPSVADHNLITASSTGALLWARQIIERLEVFRPDTLEAWYNYFSSGKEQDFFTLMQTLPPSK